MTRSLISTMRDLLAEDNAIKAMRSSIGAAIACCVAFAFIILLIAALFGGNP